MKKKGSADFRYDTGAARIPWAAVGEPVSEQDVLEFIKFLVPPADRRKGAYDRQMKSVAAELAKLKAVGGNATKLSLGTTIARLEQQAAKFLKARHACFLTNATAGFEIAYKFAGLKPGDEVIAPSITFIATIAYPLSIGAKVVFADVDPATVNMDPKDVARKITGKTRVIIPVHIGGYPVDMAPIMRLAGKNGITVIEDAAHAFGATYNGRMVGTVGHFGSYSFHEVKNITAFGEGGILVTNTAFGKDFAKTRFLGADFTRHIKHWLYDVTAIKGMGGRFVAGNHSSTEIQALCLLQQMKRLRSIISQRARAARYLTSRFRKVDGIITPPPDTATTRSSHHLYLLQIDPGKVGGDIQTLKTKLTAKGVVNIPHFAPLYKFVLMRQLGYDTGKIEATCPVTEEVFYRRFTHLPLYDLSSVDMEYMADAVIDSVNEMKAGG